MKVAVLAGEVAIGIVLGVIVTFFLLEDGSRFAAWVNGLLPPDQREMAALLGVRAWKTFGGYLRGAAILGIVEGTAIAIALRLVGAELAVPMAVVTFLAAFVPFVGAMVAGLLAVLVALGTAGPVEALIIAVVAFVIQQIDNDLLAPVVLRPCTGLAPRAGSDRDRRRRSAVRSGRQRARRTGRRTRDERRRRGSGVPAACRHGRGADLKTADGRGRSRRRRCRACRSAAVSGS